MPLFSLARLFKSFKYAFKGIICALKEEQNFRFQIVAAILIIILMMVFSVSNTEKVILIIVISLVLTVELINSIFERIVDILKPRVHPYAKKIKDMMAAAVLVVSLAALASGLIIFLPKIFEIFR